MVYGILIGVAIGVIVCILVHLISKKLQTTIGVLKVNMTNPMKEVYTIDLEDLKAVETKKTVILKVVVEKDKAQK